LIERKGMLNKNYNEYQFQDEVDKSIYSKMADDLESASQRMKKMKKNKVKKVTNSGSGITA